MAAVPTLLHSPLLAPDKEEKNNFWTPLVLNNTQTQHLRADSRQD